MSRYLVPLLFGLSLAVTPTLGATTKGPPVAHATPLAGTTKPACGITEDVVKTLSDAGFTPLMNFTLKDDDTLVVFFAKAPGSIIQALTSKSSKLEKLCLVDRFEGLEFNSKTIESINDSFQENNGLKLK